MSLVLLSHHWRSHFSSSLHACVRSNPPPNIVRLLLELVPESPSHVDCLHRMPLHFAVGAWADLCIIELHAKAYPGVCAVHDEDGKTPLHLACDSACELFVGAAISSKLNPFHKLHRPSTKTQSNRESKCGVNKSRSVTLSMSQQHITNLTSRKRPGENYFIASFRYIRSTT